MPACICVYIYIYILKTADNENSIWKEVYLQQNMEDLIKQRRVKFSGPLQDNREEPNGVGERRLTPRQKTESFKGDNKVKSWFRRQISRQMSWDNNTDGEFAASVAAAAYAVYSIEEATKAQYENKARDGLTRVTSRKEAAAFGQQPGSGKILSRKVSSNKESKNAGEASIRKSTGQDRKAPPEKPIHQSSVNLSSSRHKVIETKADAYEKAQLEKIKRRYEKMKSKILAWENEKKRRAKLRLERAKKELELRRERNLQHYNMKIENIDLIAGGARTQVDEKRRNEETEVKEKAKRIRSTGKAPVTCFCF